MGSVEVGRLEGRTAASSAWSGGSNAIAIFSASPGATGGQDLEGCPSRAGHLLVLSNHDQQGAETTEGGSQEPCTGGGVQQVSAVRVEVSRKCSTDGGASW